MSLKYFSLISGILLMVVGVCGFFPAMLSNLPTGSPTLAITYGSGLLWGILPVNIVSNLFHTFIGIWGATCYGSSYAARGYARPVNGNNIWLHAALAVAGAWFGYASEASVLVRRADKFVSSEKPKLATESKQEQKRAS
jgi:hypothetical protein